jgi:cell division protein FtsL
MLYLQVIQNLTSTERVYLVVGVFALLVLLIGLVVVVLYGKYVDRKQQLALLEQLAESQGHAVEELNDQIKHLMSQLNQMAEANQIRLECFMASKKNKERKEQEAGVQRRTGAKTATEMYNK